MCPLSMRGGGFVVGEGHQFMGSASDLLVGEGGAGLVESVEPVAQHEDRQPDHLADLVDDEGLPLNLREGRGVSD